MQGILTVKFVSAACSHNIRPNPEKMERGMQRFGSKTRPLLVLVSIGMFLASVGLVLPAAVPELAWLAAFVAYGRWMLAPL